MPDRVSRLESRNKLLKLILTTLVLGAIGFIFLFVLLVTTSYQQSKQSTQQSYRDNVETILQARAGCIRGTYERLENIDGDLRQKQFFLDAERARRAGKTKLDQKTADAYKKNAVDSGLAAIRRSEPLVGVNIKVLRQRRYESVEGRMIQVPTEESRQEAGRYCRSRYKLPDKPKNPPLLSIG